MGGGGERWVRSRGEGGWGGGVGQLSVWFFCFTNVASSSGKTVVRLKENGLNSIVGAKREEDELN